MFVLYRKWCSGSYLIRVDKFRSDSKVGRYDFFGVFRKRLKSCSGANLFFLAVWF